MTVNSYLYISIKWYNRKKKYNNYENSKKRVEIEVIF